jgi:HK97 family phage portal protein
MSSLLSRIFGRAPEAKDSRAGALLALHSLGLARWTTRNAVTLTQAGYERNAVVFRAVRMIAEAAASIPWLVFEGRQENPDHPLADLIAQPNACDSGIAFFEGLYSNLLLFGNAYVEAVSVDNTPREFHSLRPDRMSVLPGRSGWPAAYDYTVAGQKVRYDMAGDGMAPILHLKCFHPLDDYYGFAPIAAAQVALDTHNAAGFWNKALLDNAARPSGALVYSGADNGHLTEQQFERLKSELTENFSGVLNAGRPLLLEGGLDWKTLSLSPKDMDFIEAKAAAAREIALAFGVPPLVLGLPGDNTFANYAEANRAFWRQTIIPLVSRTQKTFAAWLRPAFEPFRFEYDVDRIDALAADRESEWRRIDAASFLTQDEKREAVGYGALPRGTNAAASQDTSEPSS